MLFDGSRSGSSAGSGKQQLDAGCRAGRARRRRTRYPGTPPRSRAPGGARRSIQPMARRHVDVRLPSTGSSRPAIISLVDVDFAVDQLEFALDRDARVVQLLPGPATWGCSPADPIFDPFWARVNEDGRPRHLPPRQLRLPGALLGRLGRAPRSRRPRRSRRRGAPRSSGRCTTAIARSWTRSATSSTTTCSAGSPTSGSRASRTARSGSRICCELMDNMKGMGRNGPWPNGYVHGRPSEVFKRHVFVSPHHYGEDIGALVDLLGSRVRCCSAPTSPTPRA